MKRAALVYVILALLGGAVRLQGGEVDRLMLWEIENSPKSVYLLGTVHVLQPEDYPLPAEIERVFQESTQVVFEVDLDDLSLEENQVLLLELALYLSGGSLPEDLSSATYALLMEYVQANGMDFLGFPLGLSLPIEMFRPWYVSSRIGLTEGMKYGYDAQLAPDLVLFDRAKAEGKTLLALETVPYQLGVLGGGTPFEQDRELRRTLESVPTFGEELEQIVGAWRCGDLEALRRILHQEAETDPVAFERLITARNRAWIERIEPLLESDETTLVVGGAGHMVGENGIPNQLRLRGHRVRQLPVRSEDARLPRLHFAGVPSGETDALELFVPVGWSFALQESDNLVEWRTLTTFFTTNEVHRFTPPEPGPRPATFFRLVSPP